MKDRTIICIQCSRPFVFSAEDQERFEARGFGEPKRCPECRQHKGRQAEAFANSWEKHKRKPRQRKSIGFDED